MARAHRIRIGISSCLVGQRVRYDGGHKHNAYITDTLGQHFDFVPFCPEVAIGLGVPRPPIRLVRMRTSVRARGVSDPSVDVTDRLESHARRVAPKIARLSGYILKQGSPSCGMERVKVYGAKGAPAAQGSGVFARTLMELFPELPFEEEGRLMDPVLRDNFIERVFVYHRWRQLARRVTPQRLVEFHMRHKLIVLAHDEEAYRTLGRLVARAGQGDIQALGARYVRLLMQALKRPATRTRHANVLQHIAGFFKDQLDAGDKRELSALIDGYRRGRVPLAVPMTLIRHYQRRFPQPYLAGQYYLAPHGDESVLRSAI